MPIPSKHYTTWLESKRMSDKSIKSIRKPVTPSSKKSLNRTKLKQARRLQMLCMRIINYVPGRDGYASSWKQQALFQRNLNYNQSQGRLNSERCFLFN